MDELHEVLRERLIRLEASIEVSDCPRDFALPRRSRRAAVGILAAVLVLGGAASASVMMNADGSGIVDVSRNAARNERYPDWSPDGRWIACGTDDGIVLLAATDGFAGEIALGVQGDFPAWRP